MKIQYLFLLLTLGSCGIYRSSFDCPHGKGVGCKPVAEVLDMIVEREEGPDLFIKDPGIMMLVKEGKEGDGRSAIKSPRKRKKRKPESKLQLIKDINGELSLVEKALAEKQS